METDIQTELAIARSTINLLILAFEETGQRQGFKKKLAAGLGGTIAGAVRHGRDFLDRPVVMDTTPALREKLTDLAKQATELGSKYSRAYDALMSAWPSGSPNRKAILRGRGDISHIVALLIAERDAYKAQVEVFRAALIVERGHEGT